MTSRRGAAGATRRDVRLGLAGAGALAAAMGIGRFAYTALLPSAQRALGFDDRTAGLVATVNLAGYLVGVLAARAAPASARAGAFRAGLVGVVAATALTAAARSPSAWAAVRGAAGVASGLVFVLGSALVLEAAAERARVGALLYSGVGAGIAISGAAATLPLASWSAPWLVLAAVALAAALPALATLPARGGAPVALAATAAGAPPVAWRPLATSYALEGAGYIVSGTFAVAAAQRVPAVAGHAPWVWAVAGLAAVPSVPLWTRLARRIGERRGLVAAYALQSGGMALPALSGSAAAAIGGAALFGGTFMGITALTIGAAGKLDPPRQARLIGTLTALYGVGQAAGPALAGALSRRLGDPRPSVLAAAAAVAAGAAVLAASRRP